jgi:hypothetical protein
MSKREVSWPTAYMLGGVIGTLFTLLFPRWFVILAFVAGWFAENVIAAWKKGGTP